MLHLYIKDHDSPLRLSKVLSVLSLHSLFHCVSLLSYRGHHFRQWFTPAEGVRFEPLQQQHHWVTPCHGYLNAQCAVTAATDLCENKRHM